MCIPLGHTAGFLGSFLVLPCQHANFNSSLLSSSVCVGLCGFPCVYAILNQLRDLPPPLSALCVKLWMIAVTACISDM